MIHCCPGVMLLKHQLSFLDKNLVLISSTYLKKTHTGTRFFLRKFLRRVWGLFPRVQGFWGECSTIHSPPALFFFCFLKWRLARTLLFHSLGQDQSTVAKQAETTVTECFLTSFVRAHFLIGSHTLPGQQHSQPTPTSLGEGCMRV